MYGCYGQGTPPLLAQAKKHAGKGISLTQAELNRNNWHVGVNPKYIGVTGKEPPPCQQQMDAGRGISLTRSRFMLTAPLFVTAHPANKVRSQDGFAYQRDEDSNLQRRVGPTLSDCAKD